MSKLWEGIQPTWAKVGANFANPLATVLGKNKDSSNFIDNVNYKLSNPVGQVGSVGRDIVQKKIQPDPIAPTVVPMPDQETIDSAARKARAKQLGRGGFASTILSQGANSGGSSDRLGP